MYFAINKVRIQPNDSVL
ncbi:MAG: hypothetical protein ABW072_02080 [Sedimenticola sp.]